MNKISIRLAILLITLSAVAEAQVNNVEFGKNRVQYQKFNWKYYQTNNFNVYFSEDGLGLGKYVAQIAENELPEMEKTLEYGLQRRTNIVVYNTFEDMRQSNIGIDMDWQNTGGVTKLVNNKLLVYFAGNHDNLRRQVREGIAKIIVDNILFGDDLGEVAANQAFLDLPKWLTNGLIMFTAENWSPEVDDELRGVLLAGKYRNFYQMVFDNPDLAGRSFWKYFSDKYGKSKAYYFFYLSRIYKSINNASLRITQKKFKTILKDFFAEVPQQYYKDLRGRRNAPKGQLAISKFVDRKDYIRFNANPNPKSFTYAYVEYNQGKYSVILMQDFVRKKVLLKYGEKIQKNEAAPNYPILAWDGKGTRLAVTYWKAGKLKLMVYDMVNGNVAHHQELPMFTQVQDVKYMLDNNTLLMSAVRSGQTDIYVYKINGQTFEQITNDVYDDLDPAFVAFPNKTGIIYSSNRPSATALSNEDSLPGKQFNIYLIDNWNKTEFKQISQLTNLHQGTARFPSQYNSSHFTFVSDENGIANRYAGFFKSERTELDTLIFIGEDVLRNPSVKEVDSVMKEWNKKDIDSSAILSVSNDSSYIFPLTNYQGNLVETRVAGDQQQVSEVVKMGDVKLLYRLKVDEATLKRRNVTARPTEYIRQLQDEEKMRKATEQLSPEKKPAANDDFFISEFDEERKKEQNTQGTNTQKKPNFIGKLFEYAPPKFYADYAVTGFNNSVFAINKYQLYGGGAGPIRLSNGNDFNGIVRMGTSDLMEDYKISGGFRIAPNLRDNDVLFEIYNLRRRIDWGVTLFRSRNTVTISDQLGIYPGKEISTYMIGRIKYPFDRTKSLRMSVGPRFDKLVKTAVDEVSLKSEPLSKVFGQLTLEYVYDNVLNPTTNIWKGLRYKVYTEMFNQIRNSEASDGKIMFNAGFDIRNYVPIYRNLIWAVRAAGDFSWGDQRIVYYLGGIDNWFNPKFNDNPRPTYNYTYQSLAVNLRGYKQNTANGNNALIINSEVRFPVFTTLLSNPVNNAFLRNLQLIQFVDLGTAWAGNITAMARPQVVYNAEDPFWPTVRFKAGGVGPFAGSYGFGIRSTLMGYFMRLDAGWQMNTFFGTKPVLQFAMGLDF